jgi:hypothetical protein
MSAERPSGPMYWLVLGVAVAAAIAIPTLVVLLVASG